LCRYRSSNSFDELSVPPRISDIRAVISDLDEKIGAVVGE
jgi:hypothetical protein